MHSRRSVLAGCAVVAGTATLGGCSVLDSGGSGSPDYTDWFYEPEDDTVNFSVAQYGELASVDGLPEDYVPDEFLGIPIEEFDQFLNFAANSLYEGSFGAEAFRNGLESEENLTLEADGELNGYDVYAVVNQEYRIALRDGQAAVGTADSLEQFLDAGAGEADRLVDTNDDADAFIGKLGSGHSVGGTVKLTDDATSFMLRENAVAGGQTVDYGDETVEYEQVVLFETEDDVDEEAIRSDYEDNDDLSDVSSGTDGRFVTVSYTRPTSDLA